MRYVRFFGSFFETTILVDSKNTSTTTQLISTVESARDSHGVLKNHQLGVLGQEALVALQIQTAFACMCARARESVCVSVSVSESERESV